MVAPHVQQSFENGGVRIAYRRFGKATGKTPVLFVHGLSYFSYDWVDFGTRLCTDREGCAIDMRGFGDSADSPGDDYGVPTMAADIGSLLDHLGWTRAVVVAHSMGCRSAAYYASQHADRLTGLVLLDWSPENAPEGSRRVAHTVANVPETFATVDDAMAYFGADAHSPADAARARYEAYLRPKEGGFELKRSRYFGDQFRRQIETGAKPTQGVDLWGIVRELRVPTLVVRASRSDLFPEGNVARMREANPGMEFREVPAGHHVAGDAPEATLAAIRPFIDSLETT